MSKVSLEELYTELSKICGTDSMEVSELEVKLIATRLFHELGDLKANESIAVLVDFLGTEKSETDLKIFLDDVSEELDTADTKISRAKVGHVVSMFFKLLHHFKFDEALEICSRLYQEGRKLDRPKKQKK